MKKRTYITLFLWAAALLSGCTGDEEIVGGQSSLLTVAVTAADFSSDEVGDPYHRIGYSTHLCRRRPDRVSPATTV